MHLMLRIVKKPAFFRTGLTPARRFNFLENRLIFYRFSCVGGVGGVNPRRATLRRDQGKGGRRAARGRRAAGKFEGARVKFAGEKRTVIDGPFAETQELVAAGTQESRRSFNNLALLYASQGQYA